MCRVIAQLTAVTMTAATSVARSCERSVWSQLIAERTSGEVKRSAVTAVTAASVRAVLGGLPDGPEELVAGGGVRVERGAVGKEAVEGRDELRSGDSAVPSR